MSQASKYHLEEVSLNAWPAIKQLHLDGWILRMSGGVTRRANAVIPLCKGYQNLHNKIKSCQEIYRSLDQKCYFKISEVCEPSDLDQVLADSEYTIEAPSLVLRKNILKNLEASEVNISEQIDSDWLESIKLLKGWSSEQIKSFHQIQQNIVGRMAQAYIQKDNKIVAIGLGVLQEKYLSIMHVFVEPSWRRKGLAQSITQGLSQWAIRYGCKQALLTVEETNKSAVELYDSLGFTELSKYHFRVMNN